MYMLTRLWDDEHLFTYVMDAMRINNKYCCLQNVDDFTYNNENICKLDVYTLDVNELKL